MRRRRRALVVPVIAGGLTAWLLPWVGAGAVIPTETSRVSVTSAGAQVGAGGADPAVSDDGNVVAVDSTSSALAPGDGNGVRDVFVRNQTAGTTSLASVSSGEVVGNGVSSDASISDDGTKVVFTSAASNLVTRDRNGVTDVFLRDLLAGTTVRVSLTDADTAANGASSVPVISGDGTKVAFASDATNLVSGDTNAKRDVFVRDLTLGTTTRISRSGATEGNGASTRPSISDNGTVVAFETLASNLNSLGDTNGVSDVMVWTGGASVTRLSHPASLAEPNGASTRPSVRGDGLVVVFESAASNLVSVDTNAKRDIFAITVASPAPSRVSVDAEGLQANGNSSQPTVSDDGKLVAFTSAATNLAPGDTNTHTDVFVRDFSALTTSFVSVPSFRSQANGESTAPTLAGTGAVVVYQSTATNLVNGDSNTTTDVFRSPALRCDGRRVTVDLGAGGVATANADVVRGTAAADVLTLGAGADRACLGSGDDQVDGGTEADRLFGNGGQDTLSGAEGNDAVFGEAQNDALDGGPDTDTCDGGPGTDTGTNCEGTTAIP